MHIAVSRKESVQEEEQEKDDEEKALSDGKGGFSPLPRLMRTKTTTAQSKPVVSKTN